MSATQPISDLNQHLGFWMRTVSNHVSHAFAAKLAAREVTVAEWVVLRSLYGNDPIPPSQVAAEIGMTRGAITKLADRLIAKSLIARKPSRSDGRSHSLSLTRRGTDLVPELAALADRNDAEFFDCLSGAERKSLDRILKRMVERCRITGLPTE